MFRMKNIKTFMKVKSRREIDSTKDLFSPESGAPCCFASFAMNFPKMWNQLAETQPFLLTMRDTDCCCQLHVKSLKCQTLPG